MVATASALVPVVPLTRHAAKGWPVSERAALAKQLQTLGATITELSDARELAGLPRLSEATPETRRYSHHWLRGSIGRGWLAKARELRALYTEALATVEPKLLTQARGLLGLRSSGLRLGELRALVAQVRTIELSR